METFDVIWRFAVLPTMGVTAFLALVVNVRRAFRELWR